MSRRLIEEWLPIAALGIESLRERTPMTPFPAPNRLHVWWARRPLVAARAAILASLLPADADKDRFMHALGIHGDPVAAKQRIDLAKKTGENLGPNPYGYARAFSYSPTSQEKEWLGFEARRIGISDPSVLDPTAGGGSIPFESIRLGLHTFANDINPVALLVEKATFELPLYGIKVLQEFDRIGKAFIAKAEPLYDGIFPKESPDTQILGYLFARTIRCPYCGGLIPLSPNWRLAPDGTGVRLIPHTEEQGDKRICSFEIVFSTQEQSEGTVSGGSAVCPFEDCGRVIDGDEIKEIAQTGGMGEQLYAVVYKKRVQTITKSGKPGREKWIRGYRAPRPEDDVFDEVKAKLEEKLPYWEAMDMVPTEAFPVDSNDDRPIQYGMPLWRDLFSPRQLYCHGTSVEVFRELLKEEESKPGFGDVQKAAFAYLALALDKLMTYDCKSSRWHPGREVMAQIFERHDFSVKFTFAEMAPLIVGLGYDWAIEQTGKCLTELIGLLHPGLDIKNLKKQSQQQLSMLTAPTPPKKQAVINISCQSGDALYHIEDHSIDAVAMDPPYYDNVMYAELSDFFYVWLKRTAGYVYPELFTRMLTDKENEAVANPAKFKGQKKPKDLAYDDYRVRMAAIFNECHRVLTKDGVLMLMFTHKATGAWDALTKGLLDAGFVISASWPINTEAEGSLHIKDKAAANSTIFLVCRPRAEQTNDDMVFWEELEPLVKQEVLKRVDFFQKAGISGIDLYLACFGPALEVFSKHWPVKRGSPKPAPVVKRNTQKSLIEPEFDPYSTTPEDVLHTARAAVKSWVLQQILNVQRQATLDPLLEWFVLAWHTFEQRPQFPYDEALNLARVVGLDMEKDIIGVIAEKKQSNVILWDSETRAAKAALGPASGTRSMLDVLHHAAHTARTRSLEAAKEQIQHYGLDKDLAFLDALRAVLEVLPPSHHFTGFDPGKASEPAANDFEALENLRKLAFSKQVAKPKQLLLWESHE